MSWYLIQSNACTWQFCVRSPGQFEGYGWYSSVVTLVYQMQSSVPFVTFIGNSTFTDPSNIIICSAPSIPELVTVIQSHHPELLI